MSIRFFRAAGIVVATVALVLWAGPATTVSGFAEQNASQASHQKHGKGGFEVWIADQSDTRPGFGGQLLIYEGSHLLGKHAARARPIARLDLGAGTADLCRAATGRNPVRPHMILFNNEHTHAVLSFVASGHVVIFDAATRRPLNCFETTVSSTGARQAHAAYPAPDGSFILVANQSGKRLERIDANFRTNTFAHNPAATLDLQTCTTPSGQPCEHPDLRPINWPICPFVDSSSRRGFVTLRGGGLFVVNARATPMTILAEYDKGTVKGNGCGAVEVGRHVYINSGGSPVNVSSGDPHHPSLYGFDVYRFPLRGYSAANAPNTPMPELLLSKSGMSDSHGVAAAGHDRYLWALDRHADVAEIIEVRSGKWVNTVDLAGSVSDNPAPDLVDRVPGVDRLFVALRGPIPLSGDPHNAIGSTPGLGIIQVTHGGRSGRLAAVVPLTNSMQQAGQAPDAHGLRVRIRRHSR